MFELRFFEIYRSSEYVGLLLDGLLVTGGLSLGAGAAGFLLAIIFAMVRYWHVPVIRNIAASYVEFIRNTPLIVQLVKEQIEFYQKRYNNYKPEDFAKSHPGGTLGKKLLLTAKDVMVSGEDIPIVNYNVLSKDVIKL